MLLTCSQLIVGKSYVPIIRGSDIGPFPSMFEANTVTLTSAEGRQDDEDISNLQLQIPPSQEEAGMVAEPHLLPEIELE